MTWRLNVDRAPPNWRRVQLRSFLTRSRDRGQSDLPLLSVNLPDGVVMRREGDGRPAPADDLSGYQVVRPGDLVMNQLGKPHGALGVSEHLGIISPAYFVAWVGSLAHPRWAHYLLRTRLYISEFERRGKHMPPSQFDISWEQFRAIPVALPPLVVQRAIADFLDAETVRIDALLEKKRRLAALVNESLSAAITSEWEAASQRWGATRLGQRLALLEQGWSPQCEDRAAESYEFGIMKSGCVNGGQFDWTQHKALPSDLEPRLQYRLHPGDLLMSRASGSLDLIGSAAIVPMDTPTNLILCDKLFRLRLGSSVTVDFVALMLRAHRVREAIKLGVSGGEGMANNLPAGIVRGLPLPGAPLDEQRRIARRLRAFEVRSRELVELLERSTSALLERRQALITTAVTGELEIPGAAA